MHNAALAELARATPKFAAWRYLPVRRPAGGPAPRARPVSTQRGFRGLNLTVPHKVIAFGAGGGGRPGSAADRRGQHPAQNRPAGGWDGRNTDGYGLATAVRESLGIDLAGAAVILLGAGGAARATAVECLQRRCASLWIANRTAVRLDALLAVLRPLGRRACRCAASTRNRRPPACPPARSSSTPPPPASAPRIHRRSTWPACPARPASST